MPTASLTATFAWWLLIAGALLGSGYWLIVRLRIRRSIDVTPDLADVLESVASCEERSLGKVAIIIPAHNEEGSIAACATSVMQQQGVDFIAIFVLDRCTDATAEVLAEIVGGDNRARVVHVDHCPPDWAGKCHAAQAASQHALALPDVEWLLFIDADTEADCQLAQAAISLASEGIEQGSRIDLLSLLNTLRGHHWFERIVQPAASMELLRMFPPDRVNQRDSDRNFSNGQFLLFRRDVYEAVGRHAAVKDDLLEDIAFARAVRRGGFRGCVAFDGGMLKSSMHESFAEFELGWQRIFIEAAKRKPQRLRRYARRLALITAGDVGVRYGLLTWLICDAIMRQGNLSTWWFLGLIVLLCNVTCKLLALKAPYARQRLSLVSLLLQPIGAALVARVLSQSARALEQRTPVRWGGKEYVLEPRA
ncbi:MAG: glycosyltransferase family 2 protein [Phycisphaerales bacterium]